MIVVKMVGAVLLFVACGAFAIVVGLSMILLCMAGTLDDTDED